MADLEKVIKGLECFTNVYPSTTWGECKERNCSYLGKDCELAVMADALELLKAQDVPETNVVEWISVKDRMPETRHAVLVYTLYYKNIWAASMHEDGNWYIWSPGNRVLLDPDWHGPITHWMPLPEPPKEDT